MEHQYFYYFCPACFSLYAVSQLSHILTWKLLFHLTSTIKTCTECTSFNTKVIILPMIWLKNYSDWIIKQLAYFSFYFRTDRQWRDLSFCLSMLSYSAKGLRKLQENFTCFGDKLADDDVYGLFCQIISKSKSFAKPEMKVYIHTILIMDVSKINCFYQL